MHGMVGSLYYKLLVHCSNVVLVAPGAFANYMNLLFVPEYFEMNWASAVSINKWRLNCFLLRILKTIAACMKKTHKK